MLFIYTCLLWLLLPVYICLRRCKQWAAGGGYQERLLERIGYPPSAFKDLKGKPAPIWLHAVSVGEVMGCRPVVEALLKRNPCRPLVVTCGTLTGSAQIKKLWGGRVYHSYLPYDLPVMVCRFLAAARPHVALIMETELWPNLLHYAQKMMPVILLNARLSERSARGYRRIAWLSRPMVQAATLICARCNQDAQRFVGLGAQENRIVVTGSLKFALSIPADMDLRGRAFRQWGSRPTWVAASTHPEEEAMVLEAFQSIRKQWPKALLILVPRHPQRFNAVYALCRAAGWGVHRRSESLQVPPGCAILLGDSLGELLCYYAASDVAFVGGSLVPVGGHNMLEPAALAKPVVTGQYVFNFPQVTQVLSEADALVRVATTEELAETVAQGFAYPEQALARGRRALHAFKQSGQVLERVLESIVPVIDRD